MGEIPRREEVDLTPSTGKKTAPSGTPRTCCAPKWRAIRHGRVVPRRRDFGPASTALDERLDDASGIVAGWFDPRGCAESLENPCNVTAGGLENHRFGSLGFQPQDQARPRRLGCFRGVRTIGSSNTIAFVQVQSRHPLRPCVHPGATLRHELGKPIQLGGRSVRVIRMSAYQAQFRPRASSS